MIPNGEVRPDVGRSRTAIPREHGESVSLAESAARRLSEMIRRGEFLPGQRLPPERDLAESLNLSRGALREGLRMLEMIGMVNARVGSGRFVSVDGSPSLNRGLETWMQVQPIDDIIAVRRVIEPAAIGSIPATQLSVVAEECSAILNRMSTALRKGKHEAAMRYHTQLHLALIQYSPVNLMRTLLTSMIHTSETAQLEIFRNSRAGQASIAVHAAIVDALIQGDVQLVAARVAGHLTPAFVFPADHVDDDQFDD